MTKRRVTQGAVAALVGATLVFIVGRAAGSAAQTAPKPGGTAPVIAGCTPVLLVSVNALAADGSESVAVPGDNQGRIYRFADGAEHRVPPPGFNPLTASDQGLFTYGFGHRPLDPAGLAHWQQLFANYHVNTGTPWECQLHKVHSWLHTTSLNWDGAA